MPHNPPQFPSLCNWPHSFGWLAIFGALVLIAACSEEKSPAPKTHATQIINSPTACASALPNLFATSDSTVFVSWVEKLTADSSVLRFSVLENDQWGAAKTIAGGRDWFVNWADFPALCVSRSGFMAATWLDKSGATTYAYGVRFVVSNTHGASWNAPRWLHDDTTETEHGFVSLLALADGRIGAVWLDGRQMMEKDGPMSLRFATIDSAGRVADESALDMRTCDCCQTDMAQCADGSILVVYRDRSEKEIRDIAIVKYANGRWSEPRLLHADNWTMPGCPVNGPALSAVGNTVAAVWYTQPHTDSAAVLVAFSLDAGDTFGAPIRVDDGHAVGRVDVCFRTSNEALVTWMEESGGSALVRGRVVFIDIKALEVPFTIATISAKRASGFPRLALSRSGVVVAWTRVSDSLQIAAALVR